MVNKVKVSCWISNTQPSDLSIFKAYRPSKKILSKNRTKIVITPHEGEFMQVLKDLNIKTIKKNED